jgi:hypothetical protein
MASKEFGLRGLSDCKIMPLVSDTEDAVEYGDLIDIPGMKSMSLEYEIVTDELTGDDIIIDRYSDVKAINIEIESAQISLDGLAAIMGASVETGGSGDDTWASLTIEKGKKPIYVKLVAKSSYHTAEPQGDFWVALYKCKLNPYNITLQEEYAEFSASGMAIYRTYDNKLVTYISRSKAKDIASTEFPSASTISAYTDPTISASTSSKVLLAVRVLSSGGKGVPYIKVAWQVTSSGELAGMLRNATAHTDFDGIAFVEYTTGTGTGNNTVQASVTGLTGSPVTFTIAVS